MTLPGFRTHFSGATRPILVTGTNRSGTTWLGKMLSLAPETLYIHEPFKPKVLQFLYHLVPPPFENHFHFVTKADQAEMARFLAHRMGMFYPWWQDVKVRPGPKQMIRATLRRRAYRKVHRPGLRPLLKDPLALMSVDWLVDLMDPDVVISVRHPAAYVSSIKRLNWDVGPWLFLDQPELCETRLQPFLDDLHALDAQPERDLVGEAILAWRIFHYVIRDYEQRYPSFIIVRTEDLADDPENRFRDLYTRLNLPFTPEVRAGIRSHSSAANPREAGEGRADQIARDSRAVTSVWKERLTPAEIDRIRRETSDIAPHYYGDADW